MNGDDLAPVIPLFGAHTDSRAIPTAPSAGQSPWASTWSDDLDEYDSYDDGYDACGAIEREIAERNLLRKLRARSLSVREARGVVGERDLDAATVETILAGFERLGYLDDAKLAEHLVLVGAERRGHGRQVIAQTLAKRGIPREVADAALAALVDDDAERAIDYARTKAPSMLSLDRDVALRRLVGQLGRRGYDGATAAAAARVALDEAGAGRSTVRFR